jgi:hypothetical protein
VDRGVEQLGHLDDMAIAERIRRPDLPGHPTGATT